MLPAYTKVNQAKLFFIFTSRRYAVLKYDVLVNITIGYNNTFSNISSMRFIRLGEYEYIMCTKYSLTHEYSHCMINIVFIHCNSITMLFLFRSKGSSLVAHRQGHYRICTDILQPVYYSLMIDTTDCVARYSTTQR